MWLQFWLYAWFWNTSQRRISKSFHVVLSPRKGMPQNLTKGKSIMGQVMAWCRQATSHNISYADSLTHIYDTQCHHQATGINTLRPRQNGRHFADNIFKCIFLNENVWISLRFVPKVPINNIPALVQIMAWRWPGNKPLSELIMVSLLMYICITQPQWVITIEPCGRFY